ncbi:MAG: methyltransferase domain-containing protein, partial [Thiotrichales bacterium]|nr:methyltransferase domain-containing protein [Thiotrichales bacterium]
MDTPHPSHPAGTGWDPGQYHRFTDHRLRPALDLLAHVPLADASLVYDLGCGSGNVTRLIAERFAEARVAGGDISSEVLAEAGGGRGRVGGGPG